MKTKSLIAACLAGLGVYLIVSGALGFTTMIFVFASAHAPHAANGNSLAVLAQYLAISIPFITGATLLAFASPFASLILKCARIEEDTGTLSITPSIAIALACIVTGLTVAITQVPELSHLAYRRFLVAANPQYAALYGHDDFGVPLIKSLVSVVLAFFVLFQARPIAQWLARHYE